MVAVALALQAFAQELEIISLRHRTADQVLPALRPLVEPGATLTGHGTQLIVRTSPANLAALRRALEAIDRPLRRLQISVRFDDTRDAAGQAAEVGIRGSRIGVHAQERQAGAAERIDQRIQVLEGGRAFIATGQSTPILHGSAIQETRTGFEAVPRLAADTVLVDIIQRRETPGETQGLATSVSARLGEWFEVGGAIERAYRDEGGILSGRGTRTNRARSVWLKVEEARP
jgi:hypothetical protein